jgi:superfamily II DNA helicase RecQ
MADPSSASSCASASRASACRASSSTGALAPQWGQGFQTVNLLSRAALRTGRPPVLATTATAPPHVRADRSAVGLQRRSSPRRLIARTHYEVITFHDEDEKMWTLASQAAASGHRHCATVKKVEELQRRSAATASRSRSTTAA